MKVPDVEDEPAWHTVCSDCSFQYDLAPERSLIPRRIPASGVPHAAIACVLLVVCLAAPAHATPPDMVTTFESVGITWSPDGGGPDKTAAVRFRKAGTSAWNDTRPLWFDARTSPSPPFPASGEYRGSIVHLEPGTTYEVELRLDDGPPTIASATTWSEQFPIGQTVTLPQFSDETLLIEQSGTPDGYVLYAPAEGQQAVIDVANTEDHNVVIKASYVIVRGLTLRNARSHALEIYKSGARTDIVIEDTDISGWGRIDDGGFGVAYEAGIRADNPEVERLVIQRNRIHHPRADANSWCETRGGQPDPDCSTHPDGPHGILLTDSAGNHVIRFNTLQTNDDHYFADCIGGGTDSFAGFPGGDSDVYGNHIERCWDDGIEAEGGGRNVRIWGNYLDRVYSAFGLVPIAIGPTYIWRNVVDRSRKGPPEASGSSDDDPRGRFVKAGYDDSLGGGRVYLFHNTLLQNPPPDGLAKPLGVGTGIQTSASDGEARDMISRNNILQVPTSSDYSIKDDTDEPGANDFDHDLYNGKILNDMPHEASGIKDTPVYAAGNGPAEFFLDPASPGHDGGVVLHGFNDGFFGAGPEPGAFETGAPPLEFGAEAYRDPPTDPPSPPQNFSVD